MRKVFHTLALTCLASGNLLGQVSVEKGVKPPPQEEPSSAMKLTVSLSGDERLVPVLELEPGRTRVFKETSEFHVETVRSEERREAGRRVVEQIRQKTWIPEVHVGKRLGKKKQLELSIAVALQTDAVRQKLDLRVGLVGSGREVWYWQDQLVLGVKAADVAMGALAAANAEKAETIELIVPLASDLIADLSNDPKLEIYLSLVE
jgi:hypothetical protein